MKLPSFLNPVAPTPLLALVLLAPPPPEAGAGTDAPDKASAADDGEPRIQIALLLDTSSSMQGLIDQAKANLWKIVNQMGGAKRDGRDPVLQIALYEYGRNTLPSRDGHIRKVIPLTSDLDNGYEQLIELKATTSPNSNEYCGRVIFQAVRELKWSGSAGDLKAIFIAGNESFNQGSLSYEAACKIALSKGIMVSTIYCGGEDDQGRHVEWRRAASITDGVYVGIDQNRSARYRPAPQDQQIIALNKALNATYLAWGPEGEKAVRRQARLDRKAESLSTETAVERAVSKAGKYYHAGNWDLVDAVKIRQLDISEVETDDLPASMRGMSLPERRAHMGAMSKKRSEIRKKILELGTQRNAALGGAGNSTSVKPGRGGLDDAVIKGLKKAARKRRFDL